MKSLKRLSIPILLGVLLMTILVGVANARPTSRPQQQAWRVLTVPSTACIPQKYLDNWWHTTESLYCASGGCDFMCPLNFPAAGEQAVGAVSVKRVTMFAYDNSGDPTGAAFYLFKTHPPSAASALMASGSTTDSPAQPQTVMDTSIVGNPLYRVQGPYILLRLGGPPPIRVYGSFVHYTW
jgi:hypothetical protein